MSTQATFPSDAGSSDGGEGRLTAESLTDLTVSQVQQLVRDLPLEDEQSWALLESDPRVGVRRWAAKMRRRQMKAAAEAARQEALLAFERRFWSQGRVWVAGVDEVGRGCLAGPVVAAAVVLPPDVSLEGLDDSKKLTAVRRRRLNGLIRERAVAVGLGWVAPERIDRINILQAALEAMRRAIGDLGIQPDQVLVDGGRTPGSGVPELPIVDGDARSLSIAAASVVAKVFRDRYMVRQDARYPMYGFSANKGYGSAHHLAALQEHGPCPLHRTTFGPVARVLAGNQDPAVEGFLKRLRAASSLEELEHIGRVIGDRRPPLDENSLAHLREAYRRARRRIRRIGNQGEQAAAEYLQQQGYEILVRGYRGAGGEIDLIVRQRREWVFVEVKTLRGAALGAPEERVDAAKQRRICRTARQYLQHHGGKAESYRFDVVTVDWRKEPPRLEHLVGAFTDPEAEGGRAR